MESNIIPSNTAATKKEFGDTDKYANMVSAYNNAMLLYDQIEYHMISMNQILGDKATYVSGLFSLKKDYASRERGVFEKKLKEFFWKTIFSHGFIQKYSTSSQSRDLESFVEKYCKLDFTMENIYQSLSRFLIEYQPRIEKAIMSSFNILTRAYKENRFNVPGWATNSKFLVKRKFIINVGPKPCVYSGRPDFRFGIIETLDDVAKGVLWACGVSLQDFVNIQRHVEDQRGDLYGHWIEWLIFRVKFFKKGSVHVEFLHKEQWEAFNRKCAELQGFTLPE